MGSFIDGVVMVVLGAFCVPALIAGKSPQGKEMLDRLSPYQGWIGLVAFGWGVWGIIGSVTRLSWLAKWPVSWVIFLGCSVLLFAGGMIVGFSMIQKFALNRLPQSAQDKALELRSKLVSMQSGIGIACLIGGAFVIVWSLVLRNIISL